MDSIFVKTIGFVAIITIGAIAYSIFGNELTSAWTDITSQMDMVKMVYGA